VGSGTGAGGRAQRKASEPDSAAAGAAASASASEAQRASRRRRAAMKDPYRGYEFVDLEPDTGSPADPLEPRSVASDRGAGPLGFAGTARKSGAEAAGLATLAGDEFGGGPTLPMLPGSWEPD
jgi:PPE-repeat protein